MNRDTGDCGKRAFNAGLQFAGLGPRENDLKMSDDLAAAARQLGLEVYDNDRQYITKNEAVLAIYRDGEKATSAEYHAIFCSDSALIIGQDVHTLIVGWENLRSQQAEAAEAERAAVVAHGAALALSCRRNCNLDAAWVIEGFIEAIVAGRHLTSREDKNNELHS